MDFVLYDIVVVYFESCDVIKALGSEKQTTSNNY